MNFKENSGVVALVVVAILVIVLLIGKYGYASHLAGSTSCANITCLSGGLRLVADAGGAFESDVAASLGSTLSVTGATTLTGTTTIANPLKIQPTNGVSCIGGYATSTATPIKLVFTTGSTTPTSAGFIGYTFGNCP